MKFLFAVVVIMFIGQSATAQDPAAQQEIAAASTQLSTALSDNKQYQTDSNTANTMGNVVANQMAGFKNMPANIAASVNRQVGAALSYQCTAATTATYGDSAKYTGNVNLLLAVQSLANGNSTAAYQQAVAAYDFFVQADQYYQSADAAAINAQTQLQAAEQTIQLYISLGGN